MGEAMESVAEAIWNNHPTTREWDGSPKPWPTLKEYQRDRYRGIVRAALPHIIDALAEQAEGEASATLARRFLPRMANGEMFPDMSEPARAARWLRAKAEEVRGA